MPPSGASEGRRGVQSGELSQEASGDVAGEQQASTQVPDHTSLMRAQGQSRRMNTQPRHTNHERAFARYRDDATSHSSDDELDSVPLSQYRDRIVTPAPAHQHLYQEEDDLDQVPAHRPLIDRVTNQWRNKPGYDQYEDYTDDEEDDNFLSGSDVQQDLEYWRNKGTAWLQKRRQTVPRPVQRVLGICIIVLILLWIVFVAFINPWLKEQAFWDKIFDDSRMSSANDGMGTYGAQMDLKFEDMIQVKDLDRDHLPHGRRPGRLIFIGDVHGCKHELVKLLEKVDFDKKKDHVILTGDIINKGPNTPGVVDLVREIGASCVRGNHEDKVLLLRQELQKKDLMDPKGEQLEYEAQHLPASEIRARKTARELSTKQARWLQQCPVILRIGSLPEIGELVAVHAGLAPGVPLNKQDPFQVMNMRSIDPETRVPSENRDLEPWDKVWSEWQERMEKKDRTTIIYGHDSKRGLNVEGRWAKGLDSGCVNGDQLTAFTVDAEGKTDIVQVKCREDNRG